MNYFFLIILIFLTSCTLRSKEIVAFEKVTKKVDQVLADEENFEVYGTGFLGPGYFQGIKLSYLSPAWVNQEEARRIFVRSVELIVRVVNDDKDFIQYINPPPFTSDQLFLTIEFKHDHSDRYIGMVVMVRNKIHYSLMNPETYKAIDIASETLEEAIQIIENEQNYLKQYP